MRVTLLALLISLATSQAVVAANLEGVVLDSAGRPVAGARVDIATAAPKIGPGMFCPSCYLDCAKWVKTDERGRFALKSLDPALKFRILVAAPGKEAAVTELTDPAAGEMKVVIGDLPDMPPERTVRGRIVSDLDIPIAGALIYPGGAKTDDSRWYGRVEGVKATVSDAKGMFAMLLPADYRGVDLEFTADGHAGATAQLLAPGGEEHRVVVPTGTRVRGRIEYLGQPVAGLGVAVVQLRRDTDNHFIAAVHATTDVLGEFVFEYLPPDQPYAIFTTISDNKTGIVITTKKFNAYGNHKERDLGKLRAIHGLRLSGRVELPPGQPVPPNIKLALGREPAWDLVPINVDGEGRFEIGSVPAETYEVRVNADGLAIDTAALNYQSLGPNEFGLRLEKSLTDLGIPLKPTKPARPLPPAR
jgi:hypothetical protein